MATVRELRAKFVAEAQNMKRAFQDVRKSAVDLAKNNKVVGKSFKDVTDSTHITSKKFKDANGQMYTLNKTADKTKKTFKTTGVSIEEMGKHLKFTGSKVDVLSKSIKGADGKVYTLNRSVQNTQKTFKTAGKSLQAIRKHFNATETNAHKLSKSVNNTGNEFTRTGSVVREIENVFRVSLAGIVSSARTMANSISSGLDYTGTVLQNFGKRLEETSAQARDFGGKMTKYITLPITGAITAVGGMGFKRAMGLEQVQMMMEHMSDSAEEYEQRMKNVIDLVTDTRFGSAEIGAEYAKFISASANDDSAKLFSEVAMNLATFKSNDQLIPQIGDIYTKSLQSGKIDGDMINQFTNAGVDILKVLGNKWGMGTEEVREKLQEGGDITKVLNELSQGILEGTKGTLGVTKAMGGMLEKSGENLSGQIKNFFSAISQTGERLIKETGFFDNVKSMFAELRNMLKSGELDAVLIPTFQALTKALEALVDVARKVYKWFSSLSDQQKQWIGQSVGLLAILGPIITAFGILGGIVAKVSTSFGTFLKKLSPLLKPLQKNGKLIQLLSRAFGALTGPIGIAITVISLLVAGFITAYKKSETFRTAIQNLGSSFKDFFFKLVDWVKPAFNAVLDFFNKMKDKIVSFKNEEGAQLIEAFRNIGQFIAKFATMYVNGFIKAFHNLKKVIDYIVPYVEGMFKTFWSGIQSIFSGSLNVLMGYLKMFSGLFTGDWNKMWEGIKQGLKGSVTMIWGFIKVSFFGQIIGGLINFVKDFKDKYGDLFLALLVFTKEKAIQLTAAFAGWLSSLPSKFVNNFTAIKDFVTNWLDERITSAREKTAEWFVVFVNFLKDLPSRFVKTLADVKGRLIKWFVERISHSKEKVTEWLNEFTQFAARLPGVIKKGLTDAANAFINWIEEQHELNKEFYGGLKEGFESTFTKMKPVFTKGFKMWMDRILDFFKGIPKTTKEHLSKWWGVFSDWFSDKKKAWGSKLKGWKDAIVDFFKELPKTVKEHLAKWWDVVTDWLEEKKKEWTKRLKGWKDAITDWFKSMPKSIKNYLADWWKTTKKWLKDKKNEWKEALSGWGEAIGTFFSELPRNTKKKISNWLETVKDTIVNFKDKIVQAFKDMWSNVTKWFEKDKTVKKSGKKLIDNVSKGVTEQKDDFLDKIGKFIVDIPKYMLQIGGVLFLAVGRELIKRTAKGIEQMREAVPEVLAKMWKKVSLLFSSKTKEIFKNLKDTFIGKIITNIITFSRDFRKNITNMWELAKAIFKKKIDEVYRYLLDSFIGKIIRKIISFSADFRSNLTKMWSLVYSTFSKKVNEIRNMIANSFVGRMITSVQTLKTKFVNIAKDMWTGIKKQFDNIVSGAKDLPKKIGDGIGKMATKVTDGIAKLNNKLASTLGKGVNGVIGGVNWVLGKIGVNSKIPKWEVPQYAKGTKGHPGGPAIVGDGGKHELIQTPDGQVSLSPNKDTLVNLPKGTAVLSGEETESLMGMIPAYKKGIGNIVGNVKSGLKNTAKKAASTAFNVFDYMNNPGRLLNKALETLGVSSPNESGFVGNLARGGFNKVKDGAIDYIKKKLEDFTFAGVAASGNVKSWIQAAMGVTGVPGSWLGPLSTIAMKESGGNPKAINLWDINAQRGIPSMGLMQTIMPTFMAYRQKGLDNILNPVHNAVAAINYIKRRYGNVFNVPGIRNMARGLPYVGYADGGIVDTKQLAWIAEGGWAESIISHDPAKRVSQRAIWEQTGRELGFTDQNNDEVITLLMRIAEAVEAGMDFSVIMNDQVVAKILEPIITKIQNRKNNRGRKMPK
ncbi:transglycosylase SLT domain-containing protein [Lederbergia galactosidilytica]|uniref:transglycosylase SLT domain-containing protein n=1 Tax=Lederbergia galactosidilytica TaxID=217031 RepID=UPI0007DAF3E8|nr:transglycosylase SLT domain-containing protein [Lederbergia galactosidilytica]